MIRRFLARLREYAIANDPWGDDMPPTKGDPR